MIRLHSWKQRRRCFSIFGVFYIPISKNLFFLENSNSRYQKLFFDITSYFPISNNLIYAIRYGISDVSTYISFFVRKTIFLFQKLYIGFSFINNSIFRYHKNISYIKKSNFWYKNLSFTDSKKYFAFFTSQIRFFISEIWWNLDSRKSLVYMYSDIKKKLSDIKNQFLISGYPFLILSDAFMIPVNK